MGRQDRHGGKGHGCKILTLGPCSILAPSSADPSPANVPPDCINLGQGFMNWSPPDWLRKASHEAMDQDTMTNHYSHPRGRPRLLKALSKHYSPLFENLVKENRELGLDEIVVTAGANCGGSLA